MTDVLHATHFSTNLIPLKVRTPYSPVCKAYYVSWAYGLPVLYTIGKGIAIGDRLYKSPVEQGRGSGTGLPLHLQGRPLSKVGSPRPAVRR